MPSTAQAAELLAHRAPDATGRRSAAGATSSPGRMGLHEFGLDLVEAHGRGVQDARSRPGNAAAALAAPASRHRGRPARGKEFEPAQRDEVGGAGAGADEMHGHGRPATLAVALRPTKRGMSSRAPVPAPASAAASATEGMPYCFIECSECVTQRCAAARNSSNVSSTRSSPARPAASCSTPLSAGRSRAARLREVAPPHPCPLSREGRGGCLLDGHGLPPLPTRIRLRMRTFLVASSARRACWERAGVRGRPQTPP